MTHIPAGARDIQIVERKKSADVLGTYVGPGRPPPVSLWFCMGQNVWVEKGYFSTLDPFLQERDGPRKPELNLGVRVRGVVIGKLTPPCVEGPCTQSCLTTEGEVTSDREFPVPGEPGKSWRYWR